jgi:hypothetical protein
MFMSMLWHQGTSQYTISNALSDPHLLVESGCELRDVLML